MSVEAAISAAMRSMQGGAMTPTPRWRAVGDVASAVGVDDGARVGLARRVGGARERGVGDGDRGGDGALGVRVRAVRVVHARDGGRVRAGGGGGGSGAFARRRRGVGRSYDRSFGSRCSRACARQVRSAWTPGRGRC